MKRLTQKSGAFLMRVAFLRTFFVFFLVISLKIHNNSLSLQRLMYLLHE